MISERKLEKLSKRQLKEIAAEKNENGIATHAATIAQQLLWEERYPERKSLEDDYEGWIDVDDERVQILIDELHEGTYLV